MLQGFCQLLITALLFSCTLQLHAEPRRYLVESPMRQPEQGSYIRTLLEMSLNASKAEDEVIEFKFADQLLSQERRIAAVKSSNTNSLIWVVTNKEREALLRPIRFSFFRGLYGYRLLVIRKEDQARFARIQTREDLATLIAGQGTHWPDSDILKANQLPLRLGLEREQLYKMLAAQRFDYFPRSITEIWREEAIIKSLNLVVEPRLLLYYPTALYFFVRKDNHELAERLEKGLAILKERGELDKLLFDLNDTQAALTDFKHNKRHIIHLNNPELPAATPVYPPEYWLEEAKR